MEEVVKEEVNCLLRGPAARVASLEVVVVEAEEHFRLAISEAMEEEEEQRVLNENRWLEVEEAAAAAEASDHDWVSEEVEHANRRREEERRTLGQNSRAQWVFCPVEEGVEDPDATEELPVRTAWPWASACWAVRHGQTSQHLAEAEVH